MRRTWAELLAEWALGEELTDFQSEWMERGQDLEADAFRYYAFHADAEPVKVGFVYRDEGRSVGASPDGLVGERWRNRVEVSGAGKASCLAPPATYAPGNTSRKCRVIYGSQCGLQWCDFVSATTPACLRLSSDATPDSQISVRDSTSI